MRIEMHKRTVLWAVLMFMWVPTAWAVALDYRHDYKHHTDQHSNRLKLGYEKSIFYYNFVTSFATAKNADGSQDMFGRIKNPSGRVEEIGRASCRERGKIAGREQAEKTTERKEACSEERRRERV